MVQAAAQAQAVVAAAKNRGGGLVPMNAAQISALSQIQAQAIVNARPQTALVGGTPGKTDEKPTPQQIQNQIQLQAQALVHAHTQAQIAAGIYKGGDPATSPTTKAAAKPGVAVAAATAKASDSSATQVTKPPAQTTELKPVSTPYAGVLTKGSAATQSVVAAAAAAVPQPMELSTPAAPGASFMSDNLQGIELTTAAFQSKISWSPIPLSVAALLFAFSTMLAWAYYGTKAWTYVLGEGRGKEYGFSLIFCIFIVIGAAVKLDAILDFADALIFIMAIPNLVGLYILAPEVKRDLKAYFEQIPELDKASAGS